jgi:hypothetical protein
VVGVEDLLGRIAFRDAANDHAHRHARARDARFAMTDCRIDYDSLPPTSSFRGATKSTLSTIAVVPPPLLCLPNRLAGSAFGIFALTLCAALLGEIARFHNRRANLDGNGRNPVHEGDRHMLTGAGRIILKVLLS